MAPAIAGDYGVGGEKLDEADATDLVAVPTIVVGPDRDAEGGESHEKAERHKSAFS